MTDEDAKYWKDKGEGFFDANNLEEAIKCYEKAAQMDPNDATTIRFWAEALAGLAEKKNDESLYREAFWTLPQAVYKVKQLYLNNIH